MKSLEPVRQKAKRLVAEMKQRTPDGWVACEAAMRAGIEQARRLRELEKGVAATLPNGELITVRLDGQGRYVVSAQAHGEATPRTLVTLGYK